MSPFSSSAFAINRAYFVHALQRRSLGSIYAASVAPGAEISVEATAKTSAAAAAAATSTMDIRRVSAWQWKKDAQEHVLLMNDMLYPRSNTHDSLKKRMHAVRANPVYNFLHTYYRYSAEELKLYSEGLNAVLEVGKTSKERENKGGYEEEAAEEEARRLLHQKYTLHRCSHEDKGEDGEAYFAELVVPSVHTRGADTLMPLISAREILQNTQSRDRWLGCFGFHEWAMLYKGGDKRHQEQLPLRVSQDVIDAVVETEGSLKCTHFDAWRFFKKEAQPLNIIHPMHRLEQNKYEQPGCVHATMDLFKYAYSIYPFCSSSLLRKTLALAIEARKIDMRASPYDVSAFAIGAPLCVDTLEGRRLYVKEQECLANAAYPIRAELIKVYDELLAS